MSTYGGDSYVPEAMHRKHQVDQLLTDVHQLERYSDCWRRLSNGQIACLVCPHRPVLDTFPMFIIHRQGAKHQAAALKQEKKDMRLQNEVQKRIALEASKATDTSQKSQSSSRSSLREATRKRTRVILTTPEDSKVTDTATDASNTKQKSGHAPICPVEAVKSSAATRQKKMDKGRKESESEIVSKEDEDRRRERERLLRLREAGWRLDGNGKWFKDETVEFDSDEEVPTDLA